MQTPESMQLDGETVHVDERLITAGRAGVFHPVVGDLPTLRGMRVAAGDTIGTLVQTGEPHAVESAFDGVLMGLMALPGERVRKGQPLAWMIAD
jgi:hypothetical protein